MCVDKWEKSLGSLLVSLSGAFKEGKFVKARAASAYLKLDMCETPQQTAEMNASHKERVEKRAQEE